jgi:hypothetical protein
MECMGTTTKSLYDVDFVEWAATTAQLLRERRLDEVDLEHVAEEIEDLATSDQRAVRSQLLRMLMDLVKTRIQPEREGTGWRTSIVNARQEIELQLESSPSLLRHLEANLQKTYRRAVRDALDEAGLRAKAKDFDIPETCPYTLAELLEGDLDTLWPR